MAMMSKLTGHAPCRRRFANDESGGPAVEFALIVPALILMIFGIVQLGFAFYTYNEMMNGAREGARRLAVGATVAAAQQRALDAMALDHNYTFPATTPAADEVTMTIQLALSEAMVVSVLPLPDELTEKKLTASVTMRKEN
jgi:Flp pilus assembly protein TadG